MRKEEKPDILKAGLKQPLSSEEQVHWKTYVDQHPLESSEVELELSLNDLLRQLPDQPISSNFTARVMERVSYSSPSERTGGWAESIWSKLVPSLKWVRPAILSALVLSSLFAWKQYEIRHRSREELAMSVASISEMTSMVTVDMLKDFDAIHQLSQAPVEVDVTLLHALE